MNPALSHRIRVVLLAVCLVGTALLVTRCPANRDGMPGQLATAVEETAAAARSGALALDLWTRQRASAALTSVTLSDARRQVATAYEGIAELRAEDPVDVGRRRMLTGAMTQIIGDLDTASASVRGVGAPVAGPVLRERLLGDARGLESRYR
jgi:hypothetical protein